MWNKQMAQQINRTVTVASTMLAALLLMQIAPLQARQIVAPNAEGYRMIDSAELRGPVYDFVDLSSSGGTRLNLTDDSSAEIRFGFTFEFYGVKYYTAQVSSNGYISFTGSDDSLNKNGLAIPQPLGTPGWQRPPFIAPWFDDLNPSAGGAIYWKKEGSEANHRITVQWSAVHHEDSVDAAGGRPLIQFQAILYEGSNRILFQYRQTSTNSAALSHGTSATVGIQGCAIGTSDCGAVGISYSANQPLLTDKLAIGFEPVKYGYVGIPTAPQQRDGVYGEVLTYQIEIVNGKDVATNFTINRLPGARWKVDGPTSTGLMAPNERKTFTFTVTAPAIDAVALANDSVTFKVTDYVAPIIPITSGGSSTNTQGNVELDAPPPPVIKEIASIFTLKSRCIASCFQPDSDGDGVPDSSEAASSRDDAKKIDGFSVPQAEPLDTRLDTAIETGAFHGFTSTLATTGPAGMKFTAGVLNYQVIPSRIGESVVVKFTPATAWPAGVVLYRLDSKGVFTPVVAKDWQPAGDLPSSFPSITLTLVDGGAFDDDGAVNGVIVSRLAMGERFVAVESGSGFGSGGALSGELLLLFALGGWRYVRRRTH